MHPLKQNTTWFTLSSRLTLPLGGGFGLNFKELDFLEGCFFFVVAVGLELALEGDLGPEDDLELLGALALFRVCADGGVSRVATNKIYL